jgi:hypothetical protein
MNPAVEVKPTWPTPVGQAKSVGWLLQADCVLSMPFVMLVAATSVAWIDGPVPICV